LLDYSMHTLGPCILSLVGCPSTSLTEAPRICADKDKERTLKREKIAKLYIGEIFLLLLALGNEQQGDGEVNKHVFIIQGEL